MIPFIEKLTKKENDCKKNKKVLPKKEYDHKNDHIDRTEEIYNCSLLERIFSISSLREARDRVSFKNGKYKYTPSKEYSLFRLSFMKVKRNKKSGEK